MSQFSDEQYQTEYDKQTREIIADSLERTLRLAYKVTELEDEIKYHQEVEDLYQRQKNLVKTLSDLLQNHMDPTEKCSICLEDYSEKKRMQFLPCRHYFHPICITKWSLESSSCPVCRSE